MACHGRNNPQWICKNIHTRGNATQIGINSISVTTTLQRGDTPWTHTHASHGPGTWSICSASVFLRQHVPESPPCFVRHGRRRPLSARSAILLLCLPAPTPPLPAPSWGRALSARLSKSRPLLYEKLQRLTASFSPQGSQAKAFMSWNARSA